MNENERQKIALFRYGIIAPAVSGTYDESLSLKGFFRDASKKVYSNPRGEDTMISASTIERWYYAYMDAGFDALLPKRRTDTGKSRKLDSDITEQINFLKTEYPRIPATLIHQKLIENGTIQKGTVSLSTINRYVNRLNEEKGLLPQKDMRRYEREHINEVWCGDSSVGPYITINGQTNNFVNLMSVIKTAVMRFGRPKKFNFDNGSTYKNKQIDLLAARIGSVINYNPPYTPVGKAKIERWFRTMKDHWMSQLNMNNFNSLEELSASLLTFIIHYNKSIHSSLNGKTPEDRFFEESCLIKRLSDEAIEKSFLLEYERRVSADNVIVLEGTEYEVPYIYSRKKITIRYSTDFSSVYVVDKTTGELTPIRLLNKHDNSHIKRTKVKLAGGNE